MISLGPGTAMAVRVRLQAGRRTLRQKGHVGQVRNGRACCWQRPHRPWSVERLTDRLDPRVRTSRSRPGRCVAAAGTATGKLLFASLACQSLLSPTRGRWGAILHGVAQRDATRLFDLQVANTLCSRPETFSPPGGTVGRPPHNIGKYHPCRNLTCLLFCTCGKRETFGWLGGTVRRPPHNRGDRPTTESHNRVGRPPHNAGGRSGDRPTTD